MRALPLSPMYSPAELGWGRSWVCSPRVDCSLGGVSRCVLPGVARKNFTLKNYHGSALTEHVYCFLFCPNRTRSSRTTVSKSAELGLLVPPLSGTGYCAGGPPPPPRSTLALAVAVPCAWLCRSRSYKFAGFRLKGATDDIKSQAATLWDIAKSLTQADLAEDIKYFPFKKPKGQVSKRMQGKVRCQYSCKL